MNFDFFCGFEFKKLLNKEFKKLKENVEKTLFTSTMIDKLARNK